MTTPQWQAVVSTRITHEAYNSDTESILVRFPDGVEWCYEACPRKFGGHLRHPANHGGNSFMRF